MFSPPIAACELLPGQRLLMLDRDFSASAGGRRAPAIVFDIDGVLMRGHSVIPGARCVVR